jgi:hypothetical protein
MNGSLTNLVRLSSLQQNDIPEKAISDQIILQAGDIIIAGTDGIFDNLFDEDIVSISE